MLTLPTADGTVWCKSVPAPLAHEGPLLGVLADLVPGLAPPLLGAWAEPGGAATVLLGEAPGEPLWEAPTPLLEQLTVRWVDAQAAMALHLDELAGAGVPTGGRSRCWPSSATWPPARTCARTWRTPSSTGSTGSWTRCPPGWPSSRRAACRTRWCTGTCTRATGSGTASGRC